jgi:hypothetical protein
MQRPARKARDAHKGIVGSFGLVVVRSEALHKKPSTGAAEDEWRHRVSLDGV